MKKNYFLKENINKEKNMEKESNVIIMINQNLKVNI